MNQSEAASRREQAASNSAETDSEGRRQQQQQRLEAGEALDLAELRRKIASLESETAAMRQQLEGRFRPGEVDQQLLNEPSDCSSDMNIPSMLRGPGFETRLEPSVAQLGLRAAPLVVADFCGCDLSDGVGESRSAQYLQYNVQIGELVEAGYDTTRIMRFDDAFRREQQAGMQDWARPSFSLVARHLIAPQQTPQHARSRMDRKIPVIQGAPVCLKFNTRELQVHSCVPGLLALGPRRDATRGKKRIAAAPVAPASWQPQILIPSFYSIRDINFNPSGSLDANAWAKELGGDPDGPFLIDGMMRGFTCVGYLDDFAVAGSTYEACVEAYESLRSLATSLVHSKTHLGAACIDAVPSASATFSGSAASCPGVSSVTRKGRASIRPLLMLASRATRPGDKLRLTPHLTELLHWWRRSLQSVGCAPIWPRYARRIVIETDACNSGGACIVREANKSDWLYINWKNDAGGRFASAHINVKETITPVLSILAAPGRFAGADIVVYSDSSAAVGALNKLSSPCNDVNRLLHTLSLACDAWGLRLRAFHVPGAFQVLADPASRLASRSGAQNFFLRFYRPAPPASRLPGPLLRFLADAWAPSTRASYASNLEQWQRFCNLEGVQPLAASPVHLVEYVRRLAKRGVAPGSLGGHLAAISWSFKLAQLPDITKSGLIDLAVKSAKRTSGHSVKQKDPITPAVLLSLANQVNPRDPADAAFWAAVLCCFWALLRKANVCGRHSILVGDTQADSQCWRLRVRQSKTNQCGQDYQEAGSHPLCPVQALRRHFQTNKLRSAPALTRLFCVHIAGSWCPMSSRQFDRRLARALTDAGWAATAFSGHSLRRGGACLAFDSGLDVEQIKRLGGWRSGAVSRYLPQSGGCLRLLRPMVNRRWRRRFFVLYRISGSANGINHCLLYYKNKQLAKVKGSIDLGKAKDIVTHVMPPDSILSDIPSRLTRHFNKAADSQLPFFQLDTKHKSHDRTYFFLPDSVSQMENWARSISLACGLAEEVESNDEQAMRPQQTQQFPVGITLIQQTGLLSTQPMLQRPPPPPPPRLQPAAVDDADSEAYKLPAELQADLVAEGVYGVPAEDPSVYRVPSPVPELAAARADDVYGTPPPISAEQQQQLLEQQAESSPTPPPRKNALKQPRVPPPESDYEPKGSAP
uniref:PH domain-containing protein n=1 Tax=Macrostomum lignano TaxID=282301 RepID=A0A1I8HP12_9PLAT